MRQKLVECKTCGAEIAKDAKTCPYCGTKNKKNTILVVMLVIAVILLIMVTFGDNSDNPQKIGEAENASESSTLSSMPEPKNETFSVGDKVSLNDVVVTLVDVSENKGANYMTPSDGKVFVVFEFEIENNSERDIAVSSMLSFNAYIDNYSTSMNLSATLSAGKDQLDGTIATGKKMKGVIGYEADPDWSEIEVRFTPDFWSGSEIVFVASK